MHDSFAPDDFESQPLKRCRTAPPPSSKSWVTEENQCMPIGNLQRCVSLPRSRNDYNRLRLAEKLKPEPINEEPEPQTDCYDSDAEDRRNGVPITYHDSQLIPFEASMKSAVEDQFKLLQRQADDLSTTFEEWKVRYGEFRRRYSENSGLDWSVADWDTFLEFEDAYFAFQSELFTVEDQMANMNAQLYLFFDHTASSSSNSTSYCQGDVGILEWKGVNYAAGS
ncbi:hypothetical protein F4678DRAFT_317439 [Xylaria arbuscula]|nr:hypothetical protein F4678DRAFT_317439 [Xylaria arbuscula]